MPLQRLVRTVMIELFDGVVKARLLLQEVVARGLGRLFLESQVHPFVTPVLLSQGQYLTFTHAYTKLNTTSASHHQAFTAWCSH
jgi:hypothetical protein